MTSRVITLAVNGTQHQLLVESRKTLVDVLRDDLGLTGTHVGCEHGVCGACTVHVDGRAVRACLLFAAQLEGADIATIEGVSALGMHAVQAAFQQHHGLQCGFCTPGFVMTLIGFLREHPGADEAELVEALSGNLCRCTGYQGILAVARSLASGTTADSSRGIQTAARESTP